MNPLAYGGLGPGTDVPDIDLHTVSHGTTVRIVTTTAAYAVKVAKFPRVYIQGDRRVIDGVRVSRELDTREWLDDLDIEGSMERIRDALQGQEKFPDKASRDVRRGQTWQVNDDDPTGPVQSITVYTPTPSLRERLQKGE